MTKKMVAKKKKPAAKGKKKAAATKKSATLPRIAIDAMPPERRKAVFRAVEKTLRDARVAGKLDALHFETGGAGLLCPPGTTRRMVCRKDDDGVVNCEPQCVTV